MAGTGWLADQRTEAAAARILDAAEQVFASHDPAGVGMGEIARAAGCSRATLYRYFENREVLYAAYVRRWARALSRQLAERLTEIGDPRERLITAITEAMALVRANPALASWFERTGPPIGATMADQSEIVTTMTAAFLAGLEPRPGSVGTDTSGVFERRARWLVRVLTSLLTFPGSDAAEERALLEEFVVPVVAPLGDTTGRT